MNKNRLFKTRLFVPATAAFCIVAVVFCGYFHTERTIESLGGEILKIGRETPLNIVYSEEWQKLPLPVIRFLDYLFPNGPVMVDSVQVSMEGQFRRPQKDRFMPTKATQIMASRTPAFVFAATTPIVPGIWARAYDFFAEGKMQMRAKIASVFSVVDEKETPELNKTSLRRWLLESSLCPAVFLPGGAVRWEPIDDYHARAVVFSLGIEASLVASFRTDGSLESFRAEENGDLSKPYHGSGECVIRDDYQLIDGMRIPMSFKISRVADGRTLPFWIGRVVSLSFEGEKNYPRQF